MATPNLSDEVGAYAVQITNMLAFPMVMQAAVELDLLEIIAVSERSAGRPISAAEIADQLQTSNKEQAADKLDRMLRLLAAFAVVTCSVDGGGCRVYGLAPVARYFVRDRENESLGPYIVLAQDVDVLTSWHKLKDSILDGGVPFNKAHGMQIFEHASLNPRFNNLFNLAMFNHTSLVVKKVLEHYKGFEDLKQLVDVGGGVGHTLQIILSKYPKLKGVNFDLPHVIDQALPIPGVEHICGDMFKSVPSPAEAILMKWILHDWSDEHCVKVLTNCYNALPNNGKVILLEHVLVDEIDTTTISKAILLQDAVMMTHSTGGRERTRKEFISLANASGFFTIKFEVYVFNFWVIEFYK